MKYLFSLLVKVHNPKAIKLLKYPNQTQSELILNHEPCYYSKNFQSIRINWKV